MGAIFDIIAIPLGWLLEFIYAGVQHYFLAIFLFTLLVRILLFPLSLKSQKSQADRARLAPRLERLQKKYAKDQKKFQEKQMALYEKEGVSPTGGCLPMLAQMLVLFGIISVIYSPVKHLSSIPVDVADASVYAFKAPIIAEIKDVEENTEALKEEIKKLEAEIKKNPNDTKLKDAQSKKEQEKKALEKKQKEKEGELKRYEGYYKELLMLQDLEAYEDKIKTEIMNIKDSNNKAIYTEKQATEYYGKLVELKKDFDFFGTDLLRNPWNGGFAGISILWLIPLLSGLTAMFSSMLSMHYTKMGGQNTQQGQGCSNVMMIGMMPLFSLYITFTVPGGVGIYWICSNLIALLQTFILNKIYNPAKIRAQAEVEYEERRKKKLEDKKRLAEARAREQRELAKQMNEEKATDSKKKGGNKKPKAEPAAEEKTEEAVAEDEKPAEENAE